MLFLESLASSLLLRSLVLAVAFFLRSAGHPLPPVEPQAQPAPSPSGPDMTACQPDIRSFCGRIPVKRLQGICVAVNWGRVSSSCKEAVINAPDTPCAGVIRTYCRKVGPKTSLLECLADHVKDAPKSCRAYIEDSQGKGACELPRQVFCKGKKDLTSCLVEHADDISFACLEMLRWSPNWTKPCRADEERLCGREKGHQLRRCIADKVDQLSPLCRKVTQRYIREMPCASDIPLFCGDVPPGQLQACMARQSDKLSKPCLRILLNPPAARQVPSSSPGNSAGNSGP